MSLPGLSILRSALRRTNGPGPLRQVAAAYRQAPAAETIVVMVLLVGLAAAAATSLNANPTTVAGWTVAAIAITHTALRYPAALLTCGTLAGFALMSPIIASAYLAAMGATDYGIVMTLCIAAAIVAIIAHRSSRSHPSVTVLLALMAMAVGGPALAFAFPALGTVPGFALAGLVLLVRSGKVRLRRAARPRPDLIATGSANLTQKVLADLPGGYTVLRDVHVPNVADICPHLVIGPGGIAAIGSLAQPGILREHPTRGLELDGEPLAPLLSPLLDMARGVAGGLDVPADAVVAALVLHGTRLPRPRIVVALVGSDGRPAGRVAVLSPDAVIAEVTSTGDATDAKTVAALIKRARKFKATPVPVAGAPEQRTVTVLDDSGLPKEFTAPSDPQPLFRSTSVDSTVLVGECVALLTDQGTFAGVRVCSAPQAGEDATIMVQVCAESEWAAAQDEHRDPEAFPYPLASVTAA